MLLRLLTELPAAFTACHSYWYSWCAISHAILFGIFTYIPQSHIIQSHLLNHAMLCFDVTWFEKALHCIFELSYVRQNLSHGTSNVDVLSSKNLLDLKTIYTFSTKHHTMTLKKNLQIYTFHLFSFYHIHLQGTCHLGIRNCQWSPCEAIHQERNGPSCAINHTL